MQNEDIKPGKTHKNAASSDHPKTNQDFNSKKPVPHDPELKANPPGNRQRNDTLLPGENTDPADADGNGNLINEYDDTELYSSKNASSEAGDMDEGDMDEDDDPDIDFTSNKSVRNPDAREL